jgi:hypothetical protein
MHGSPALILFVAAKEKDVLGNVGIIAGIRSKEHEGRHNHDIRTVHVLNRLGDTGKLFTMRRIFMNRINPGHAAHLNATGQILLNIGENFVSRFAWQDAGTDHGQE